MTPILLLCFFPTLCIAGGPCAAEKPMHMTIRYQGGMDIAMLSIDGHPPMPALKTEEYFGGLVFFAPGEITANWMISTGRDGGKAIMTSQMGLGENLKAVWAEGRCEVEVL